MGPALCPEVSAATRTLPQKCCLCPLTLAGSARGVQPPLENELPSCVHSRGHTTVGFIYVAAASTSHVTQGSNVAVFPGVSVQARPPCLQAPGSGTRSGWPLGCAAGRQGGGCELALVTTTHGSGSVFSSSCPPAQVTQLGKTLPDQNRKTGRTPRVILPPSSQQLPTGSVVPLRGLPCMTHSAALWLNRSQLGNTPPRSGFPFSCPISLFSSHCPAPLKHELTSVASGSVF